MNTTTTIINEYKDSFGHVIKTGDIVLYRPEGKSPTTYKGIVKTIYLQSNRSAPDVVLTITDTAWLYNIPRIGTESKKICSLNTFALKP